MAAGLVVAGAVEVGLAGAVGLVAVVVAWHGRAVDTVVVHGRVVDMVAEHGPGWEARHRQADRVELAVRVLVAAPSHDRVAVRVLVARDCSLALATLEPDRGPPHSLVREMSWDRVGASDRDKALDRERALAQAGESARARGQPAVWAAAYGLVLDREGPDCLDWVG